MTGYLPWNHGKVLPIALIILPRGDQEVLRCLCAGRTSEQWGLGRQTTWVSDTETCTFSSVTRLGVWLAWTLVPPRVAGRPEHPYPCALVGIAEPQLPPQAGKSESAFLTRSQMMGVGIPA